MKIDITWINPKIYPINKIGQWVWYFRQYKYLRGFNVRLFGFHFNIRENISITQINENYLKTKIGL